jgi:hypothetical protein
LGGRDLAGAPQDRRWHGDRTGSPGRRSRMGCRHSRTLPDELIHPNPDWGRRTGWLHRKISAAAVWQIAAACLRSNENFVESNRSDRGRYGFTDIDGNSPRPLRLAATSDVSGADPIYRSQIGNCPDNSYYRNLFWLGAAIALAASCCAVRFELHRHHQVVQLVSAPAAQPAHVPVAEARPQRHRCTKAKELGFQLHCVDRRISTFMARQHDGVKLTWCFCVLADSEGFH